MTAFAVSFSKSRVIVCADTLAYSPDRVEAKPLGFFSKVFPLPHLKAVVFGRGMMQIPAAAALWLSLSPQINTIETAAAELQTALRDATERYCAEHDIADPTAYGMAEIALAGWSEAERRMKIFYYFNGTNYAMEEAGTEHYGMLSMPILPQMPPLSGPIDKQLIAIMHAEQRYFADNAEEMGGARLGGEVQAWTITPEGISQRVIYKFNSYENDLHAGAAVAQRIISGRETVDVAAGLVPIGDVRMATDAAAADTASAPAPGSARAEKRRAQKAARKARRHAA